MFLFKGTKQLKQNKNSKHIQHFFSHLDCIASADSVRVAPSLKSQKGAIWTKRQTDFDWWEIEVSFRVSGRGRIGADGLVCVVCLFYYLWMI